MKTVPRDSMNHRLSAVLIGFGEIGTDAAARSSDEPDFLVTHNVLRSLAAHFDVCSDTP